MDYTPRDGVTIGNRQVTLCIQWRRETPRENRSANCLFAYPSPYLCTPSPPITKPAIILYLFFILCHYRLLPSLTIVINNLGIYKTREKSPARYLFLAWPYMIHAWLHRDVSGAKNFKNRTLNPDRIPEIV